MLTSNVLENHHIFMSFLDKLGTKELARLLRIREKYGELAFDLELKSVLNKDEIRLWKETVLNNAKQRTLWDIPRLILSGVFGEKSKKYFGKKDGKSIWRKNELRVLQKTLQPQITMLASHRLLEELRLELGDRQLDQLEELFTTGSQQEVWEILRQQLSDSNIENLDDKIRRLTRESTEVVSRIYTQDLLAIIKGN